MRLGQILLLVLCLAPATTATPTLTPTRTLSISTERATWLSLEVDAFQALRHTVVIRKVINNGEVFDGANLGREWPSRRALPEQRWWFTEPADKPDTKTRD